MAIPIGRTWKMLASVLYSERASSSKRTSPRKKPCKSSRTRPRCCSSTERYLREGLCDRFILHRTRRMRRVFAPPLMLLGAYPLLAIALTDRQLEWTMRVGRGEPLVMRIAAVAHHGIADRQVQDPVDHRRADQDGPRKPFIVPEIRVNRREAGDDEDGHAEPVWEVLLLVELGTAADHAMGQRPVGGGDVLAVVAAGALPVHGNARVQARRAVADGTGEQDKHALDQGCGARGRVSDLSYGAARR